MVCVSKGFAAGSAGCLWASLGLRGYAGTWSNQP